MYHLHSDKFIVEDELPLAIPAGSHKNLHITFAPGMEVGDIGDILTINSDINTEDLVQRISQQVNLKGLSTEGQGIGHQNVIEVIASPNPVKDVLKLRFIRVNQQLQINVLDYTGKKVLSKSHIGNGSCFLDMKSLNNGMYFIELRNVNMELLNILKIIKLARPDQPLE